MQSRVFSKLFLQIAIREWNKLESDIHSCITYTSFSKAQLSCIKSSEKKKYNIHDQVGVEILLRLRLELSHLGEHKFRHKLEDTLNPLPYCSIESKLLCTFFLHFFASFLMQSGKSWLMTWWTFTDLSRRWIKTVYCHIEVVFLTTRQTVRL